jgi:MFS family permease
LRVDISPLRRRSYRLLYLGQFVSTFGSMLSFVALPFVLYESTKSTILTGLLGAIQLVPSIVGGLFGGTLADAIDRRKLIVTCELGMALIMLVVGLSLGMLAPSAPSAPYLLTAAAAMAVLNGFHRPALEALTPQLLDADEMAAAGALNSFRFNVCMIAGPAVAGVLIAKGGAASAFYLDAASFLLCVWCVLTLPALPRAEKGARFSLAAVREGFAYAMSRQELIGTYVVDIIAMTFSMPNLLFPAVAEVFGDPVYLGWLHSSIAAGALLSALSSSLLTRYKHHGAIILLAAGTWSLCMAGFGMAQSVPLALAFLVVAGYADGVSGIFRQTVWNQTIPSELRGRLAGIEMISYLSGPMLGNTQLGVLSSVLGIQRAITLSSLVGLGGVLLCGRLLPRFRNYVRS